MYNDLGKGFWALNSALILLRCAAPHALVCYGGDKNMVTLSGFLMRIFPSPYYPLHFLFDLRRSIPTRTGRDFTSMTLPSVQTRKQYGTPPLGHCTVARAST